MHRRSHPALGRALQRHRPRLPPDDPRAMTAAELYGHLVDFVCDCATVGGGVYGLAWLLKHLA